MPPGQKAMQRVSTAAFTYSLVSPPPCRPAQAACPPASPPCQPGQAACPTASPPCQPAQAACPTARHCSLCASVVAMSPHTLSPLNPPQRLRFACATCPSSPFPLPDSIAPDLHNLFF
eukprot:351572-Chlamydomonas_euryale.AAC.3